jgi:hypothetical protein
MVFITKPKLYIASQLSPPPPPSKNFMVRASSYYERREYSVWNVEQWRMCSVLSYTNREQNVNNHCVWADMGWSFYVGTVSLGALREKHAVQHEICIPTSNLLQDWNHRGFFDHPGRSQDLSGACRLLAQQVRHPSVAVLKPWFLRSSCPWMREARCIILRLREVYRWSVSSRFKPRQWLSRHWLVSRHACRPFEFCVWRGAVCKNSFIV